VLGNSSDRGILRDRDGAIACEGLRLVGVHFVIEMELLSVGDFE
jgi:hypothetical protein